MASGSDSGFRVGRVAQLTDLGYGIGLEGGKNLGLFCGWFGKRGGELVEWAWVR